MASALSVYPSSPGERDRWILRHRPPRNEVSPERPYAFHHEVERSASGEMISVATIFLTNRECPWRCVMCDLWRNTLSSTVAADAIPKQIEYALSRLPAAKHIKLYNSGSFFDPHAIPPASYAAVATLLEPFERVIVESHPLLVSARCLHFRSLLKGQLEVAMGLETIHPVALERLNKRISPAVFAVAARRLQENSIPLRAFVLVHPPFVAQEDADYWTHRSIDFAFHCKAEAISLIPTRAGNGAMEQLMINGSFVAPTLGTFEDAVDYALGLQKGRVFADLWDIEHFARCSACGAARAARLRVINERQILTDRIVCPAGCKNA